MYKWYNRSENHDFIILPNHFTSLEQEFLLDQSLKKFKRVFGKKVTYQDAHFDGVIHGYRECQSTHWDDDEKTNEIFNKKIFSLFPENLRWLPVHLLELANYGGIKAHIDNVE
ncbi:8695_t:CDS:2, partial [Dentiscutata erythropus]